MGLYEGTFTVAPRPKGVPPPPVSHTPSKTTPAPSQTEKKKTTAADFDPSSLKLKF